jgi:twitching motility two-component system response regulator PilH
MGKRVLVVDDDPDVRLFSVTVLEETARAAEAENGEDGLQMIGPVADLVILDVSCPGRQIRLYRDEDPRGAQNVKGADRIGITKSVLRRSGAAEFRGAMPAPGFLKAGGGDVLADHIKNTDGTGTFMK